MLHKIVYYKLYKNTRTNNNFMKAKIVSLSRNQFSRTSLKLLQILTRKVQFLQIRLKFSPSKNSSQMFGALKSKVIFYQFVFDEKISLKLFFEAQEKLFKKEGSHETIPSIVKVLKWKVSPLVIAV